MGGGGVKLMVWDFIMSFMWVWSSVIIKMLVYNIFFFLGYQQQQHQLQAELLKSPLSIINMFFFAWLSKKTKGGAYNPLTLLSPAISADFNTFLFTLAARIPAQAIGSVTGVRLILDTFPEIGRGPRLNVDIHKGALTEGLLTFAIVSISLRLSAKIPGNFFMKTWITSLSKLSLHILGSDLTGGCMNPASVMGWAYARGDHITKEHIFVYWLAPIEATLLAVWIFRLLSQPLKEEDRKLKAE